MVMNAQFGQVLEQLSFEVRGETSDEQPQVLSCGGIFFPRRNVPLSLRTWKQIVIIPGKETSAKVFGISPPDATADLQHFFFKENLN